MNRIAIKLITLAIAVSPFAVAAQSNIKSAFDAIINCPAAEISDSHFLQKDPKTKLKTGQDDVYNFVIPASKKNLVKNVVSAFERDENIAFFIRRGRNMGDQNQVVLHSEEFGPLGNGRITIDDPQCNYIYALVATSNTEDPNGRYRYAYGFNYKEENGVISGKMVINYATTSEYRNQLQRQRQIDSLAELDKLNKKSKDEDSQQSWFEQVVACLNGLKDANSKTRIALATKAYKLVSNMKDYEVSAQDKNTIRRLFEITADNGAYQDPILLELLEQCEKALK